jgi:hypothetical protein
VKTSNLTEPDTLDIDVLVQNFRESQKGREEDEEESGIVIEDEKCREDLTKMLSKVYRICRSLLYNRRFTFLSVASTILLYIVAIYTTINNKVKTVRVSRTVAS